MQEKGKEHKVELYEDQFTKLIEAHKEMILHVCCTRTRYRKGAGDIKSTEDLFQEIASELWNTWSTLRTAENQAGWIYRVAVNVAIRQYRTDRRIPPHESLERHLETLSEPSDESIISELYKLIDNLDEKDRELILHFLDGMKQADIGERMGLSEDAVTKRIRRIKDKMKDMNEKKKEDQK